jgi:hypothetical protein
VVKGPSGGGKSFTVDTVLRAFPERAFHALSGMSERALAYSKEPLEHRILVVYEAAGLSGEFQSYLMRSLLSEGRIRYETVEKTQDGLVPKLVEREGPTGLIITTTWASLNAENETRMLSLTVRDDRELTKSVMELQAEEASGSRLVQPDLAVWHAFQEWLELAGSREVVIPYAPRLAELANPSAVRLRRDFGVVLNLIRTHAMLHQQHRGRDDKGRVIANLDDYRAVYALVSDLVSEGVKATASKTIRQTVDAVEQIRRGNNNQPAKVAEVAKLLGLDDSAALRRVRTAIELGYLINLEDRKYYPAKLVLGDPLPEEVPVLPHPDALGWEEGGDTPSVCSATLQPSEPESDDNLWEGVL